MWKTLGIIQIVFSLICGIAYPVLLIEGWFDGYWYGIIGAGVAVYGSLFGGMWHFYNQYMR